MAKKIRYLLDGQRTYRDKTVYVKCWRERRDFAVQVWLSGIPEGEPDGDWLMPGVLGPSTSIDQAIAQTNPRSVA